MKRLQSLSLIISVALIVPVSPNYALRELDFGAGGGTAQSTSYHFEGVIGEQGLPMSGTAYNGGLGFGFTQMAFVPAAPNLDNPSNYYNRLHLTIDPTGNPSDALFAIAISDDGFATTMYVKADQAISDTLAFSDYQSLAAWGGASGFDILGLEPGTTYQAKVKAFHGNFTESGFGPADSASTVNPSLTFDIDVAATDTTSSPPYTLALGTLLANTVSTGTNKIWTSLDTNGLLGANVYIAGQNAGLFSPSSSYEIGSVTGDLDGLSEGFGFQGDSINQASGGPFMIDPAFDLTGNEIQAATTTYQTLFSTVAPISSGRGSVLVKAKAASSAPARSDYSEILTVISAVNF